MISLFASNFVANAQKGAYADLTDLAPKYAKEAYDQLDEAYIKSKTPSMASCMPFLLMETCMRNKVLTFNKQYLDKYDIDISNINSYADAEDALKKFHEKEPNIASFAIGQTFNISGNYDYVMGKDYPFAVKLDGDTTKIINPYEDDEQNGKLEIDAQMV